MTSWEPKGKLCEEDETIGWNWGGAGWNEGWTGWNGLETGWEGCRFGKGRSAAAPAG